MQNDQWSPKNAERDASASPAPTPAPPLTPALSAEYGGEGVIAYAPPESSLIASPRLDRWGIRLAWLTILIGVGLMAWRAIEFTQAMDELTSGSSAFSDKIPVHRVNPQLTMQAKAVIGMKGMVGAHEANLTEQLREAVKTPGEKVWIVPIIAEIDGKDAALKELDRVSPPTSATTLPATTQPATTQAATTPSATTEPVTTQPAATDGRSSVQRDADQLRKLYEKGPTALTPEEIKRLQGRLGWSGKLALTFGQSDSEPHRAELLQQATVYAATQLGVTLTIMAAVVAGLVLLILGIIQLTKRRMRLQYEAELATPAMPAPPPSHPPSGITVPLLPPLPPGAATAAGMAYIPPAGGYVMHSWAGGSGFPPAWPPPMPLPPSLPYRLGKLGESNGRTGPFIEAFAVYLASYIGFGAIVHAVFGPRMGGVGQWLAFVAAPLGLLWPWVRGVRGAAWRRGFGWTLGRGVFREMLSGVMAYVAGLPLIGVGILVVVLLQKLTQTHAYHPIATETGDSGGIAAAINLLLIAAVAAPVVEETFFRGALFHHLRTRWSWLMAALISSLIFAGVHPQGMTGVPVLGTIAIVFCVMREWRSSIIASMTAHALNNGTLVLLLLIGTA